MQEVVFLPPKLERKKTTCIFSKLSAFYAAQDGDLDLPLLQIMPLFWRNQRNIFDMQK